MRKGRMTVSGTVYDPLKGLVTGSVIIEQGRVSRILYRASRGADIQGTVIPTFVNAHTHMGDACIDAPPHGIDLAGYVRPPKGYKHVVLARTSRSEKVDRIKEYLAASFWNGISQVHDFREEGVEGLRMAKDAIHACKLPIHVSLYGRPTEGSSPEDVLAKCDGFGISSLEDVGGAVASALAKLAHQKKKRFALHASEDGRVDVRPVLALKPTFMVHMCDAVREDFEACAKARVPVVVCPRSNAVFERSPDVQAMIESGVQVMLGTDNASVSTPDMFEEMRFLYLQKNRRIAPLDLLNMALLTPRKVFKAGARFVLWDSALVLTKTFRSVESILLKARTEHIHAIVTDGRAFRRPNT
jgi:cytosine/adenosine deaminase-related metal-dependent hydrolase